MERLIIEILKERQPERVEIEGFKSSAVLLLLFEKDGEYHVLFTKRSDKVEHHKGQISFVGGMRDEEDDSLLITALREAHEEIGLIPGDVKILGRLDDIYTAATKFIISPFVGIFSWPYSFEISEDEIDEMILVPLKSLAEECDLEVQEVNWKGEDATKVYYFYYEDHIIWGATARILNQFLNLIYPSRNY